MRKTITQKEAELVRSFRARSVQLQADVDRLIDDVAEVLGVKVSDDLHSDIHDYLWNGGHGKDDAEDIQRFLASIGVKVKG